MNIEVATLLRTGDSQFEVSGEILDRSLPETPWVGRPRCVVSMPSSATYGEVINAAGAVLGIRTTSTPAAADLKLRCVVADVLFAAPRQLNQPTRVVAVLNRNGSAFFNPYAMDVTIAELLEAKERSLFEGDPLRVFLVLDTPPLGIGRGGGQDYWSEVASKSYEVFMAIGGLYGSLQAIKAIKTKVRRLIPKGTRWRLASNGASADSIINALSHPRSLQEIAQLLSMAEKDAARLLRFLGLEESGDGQWRPAESVTGILQRQAVRVAAVAVDSFIDDEHWQLMLQRVRNAPKPLKEDDLDGIIKQVSAAQNLAEQRWLESRQNLDQEFD